MSDNSMRTILKIRVYKDTAKQWRWTIKRNYSKHIVGASTEGYRRKADALKNLTLITGLEFPPFSGSVFDWSINPQGAR